MINKWFKQEVEQKIGANNRLVICDPQHHGCWLLNFLNKTDYMILSVADTTEELSVRYEAEKSHADKAVILYVNIPMEKITFLQEYIHTCGVIDFTDLTGYIKHMVFGKLQINTTLSAEKLLLAAKLSKGHDENWWKSVLQETVEPLDIKNTLLIFLNNPTSLYQELDKEIWDVFSNEVYGMIGKIPTNQKPEVFAQEVAFAIFDALIDGSSSEPLLSVYYAWTDSESMKASLTNYIDSYQIDTEVNIQNVYPDHCFDQLDRALLRKVSNTLKEGYDTTSILHSIKERMNSKRAMGYKSKWLNDVLTLLEFKITDLYKVNDVTSFCQYYQSNFAIIDRAIRNIYVAWLNESEVLRPLQEYYEELNKSILDKWYHVAEQYTPTQHGLVVDALQRDGRIAVIVGDGLRLEIAEEIISNLNDSYRNATLNNMALAQLPSVTENGMSALYGCNGIELQAQVRFNCLVQQVPNVQVIALDSLNDGVTAEKLVLTYGDIDQVGEKKQLSGLKDISNYTEQVTSTIKSLLSMGYNEVYLTADHGFVITGILDEADKNPTPSGDDKKVEERFIKSNTQLDTDLIEKQSDFCGFNYQYYAKSDKPFVSRGAYGYAHGGFTPQECIIPFYCVRNQSETLSECKVNIANKQDLSNVVGSFFKIKLKAEGNASILFESERKVILKLFEGNIEIQSSPIITLKAGEEQSFEYELPKTDSKIVLIDALSTKQLDNCTIKKSTARDLGGLL